MAYKDKKEKFFMFLVFLVLGIMVSTQFRSAEMQRSHNINQQRAEDLVEKTQDFGKGKDGPSGTGQETGRNRCRQQRSQGNLCHEDAGRGSDHAGTRRRSDLG